MTTPGPDNNLKPSQPNSGKGTKEQGQTPLPTPRSSSSSPSDALNIPKTPEVICARLRALIEPLSSGGNHKKVDKAFAAQVEEIAKKLASPSNVVERAPYTLLADILNLATDHIHNMPRTMAAMRSFLQRTYESLAQPLEPAPPVSRTSFLDAVVKTFSILAIGTLALGYAFPKHFPLSSQFGSLYVLTAGVAWLLSKRAQSASPPPAPIPPAEELIDCMNPVWEAALKTPAAPEVTEHLVALESRYDLRQSLLALALRTTLKYLCPIRGRTFTPSKFGECTLFGMVNSDFYTEEVRAAASPIVARTGKSELLDLLVTGASVKASVEIGELSEYDQFLKLRDRVERYRPLAQPEPGILRSPYLTQALFTLDAMYHENVYHPDQQKYIDHALTLRSIWTEKGPGEMVEKPEDPGAVISYLRDIEDDPGLDRNLIRLIQEQTCSSILSGLNPDEKVKLDEPNQQALLIMAGRSTMASELLAHVPLSTKLEDTITRKAELLTKAIVSQRHQTGPLILPKGVSLEDAEAILSPGLVSPIPPIVRSSPLRTALNLLHAARQTTAERGQ